MVRETPDLQEVLFGERGAVEALRNGAVVIDMSTMSPSVTRDFATKIETRNGQMPDALSNGGERGAESGKLSIMVGGPAQTFARCLPIFEVLGENITHVGPTGSGQLTKL